MTAAREVTELLRRWRSGDVHALDALAPLLYDELRRLAARHLRRERANHTLQATELVHELFLRLVDAEVPWQDSAHFRAVAARTIRRLLVDHARARAREKRGGGLARVTLKPGDAVVEPAHEDILTLDAALLRFSRRDQRAASAIELHHFGGLNYDEAAEVLGVSPATVKRDLQLGRAWLRREIAGVSDAH